jgi:hypothetical protein
VLCFQGLVGVVCNFCCCDDPRRPEYAPSAVDGSQPGIISWSMQLSDDGNMAIVHYVAADRSVFNDILNDKRGDIRVFEIGKDKPDAIEKELQKHKKDFRLADIKVVVQ